MKNEIIKEIFKSIEDKKYVIVKSFSFDKISEGTDIDIYCYSVTEIRDCIISKLNEINLNVNYKIKIEDFKQQIHLDIIKQNKLILRFDLFDSLPSFKKVDIRKSFFDTVIETREKINHDLGVYFIANNSFNNLIRYIEYIEYFEIEHNKIKHLEYLENNLKSNEEFFNSLHYYLKIPLKNESRKRRFTYDDLMILRTKIKQTPIIELPFKVFKFLFR